MPVTYADVWEFWLRYREIAAAVDFITIHILPYWEDFPIPAQDAAAHVDAIRKQVAAAFPDSEILIGEFGWPSAGRMREGALPSRANQARAVQEVLAQAKRDELPGQCDRGLRPALEATARRHGRGTLGRCTMPMTGRPNSAGEAGLQPSRTGAGRPAAAWRSRPRSSPPRCRARRRRRGRTCCPACGSHRRDGVRVRNARSAGRSRTSALESLTQRRLAALPGLGAASRWSPRWLARPRAASGMRLPSFRAHAGPHGAAPALPRCRFVLGSLLIVLAVLAMQAALGLVLRSALPGFSVRAA